jgi:hypothetical protein
MNADRAKDKEQAKDQSLMVKQFNDSTIQRFNDSTIQQFFCPISPDQIVSAAN